MQEPERLTARELEVLRMISDGLANKEIAWTLCISEKTVKKHVSMILDKFGLQSRTQAALHAWRVGLARPEPGMSHPEHVAGARLRYSLWSMAPRASSAVRCAAVIPVRPVMSSRS